MLLNVLEIDNFIVSSYYNNVRSLPTDNSTDGTQNFINSITEQVVICMKSNSIELANLIISRTEYQINKINQILLTEVAIVEETDLEHRDSKKILADTIRLNSDVQDSIFHELEGVYPSYIDLEIFKKYKPLFKEDELIEEMPEFEFKSIAQKVSWLHELGVLQTILNRCKQGETYNWSRAANIINSFTDINNDTIRKGLMAIYDTNKGNEKNNPLNNADNKRYVSEMLNKFKLDKEQ
jgi:hypothetical protein